MSTVELRGVHKSYGVTLALRRGDLSIDAGEVHALIGSNGSGKSTMCKILTGSIRPNGGLILKNGKPITIANPHSARKYGIGIFHQELSLAEHRTIAENIGLPDLPATRGGLVDRSALARRAARYIALFDSVAGKGFFADAVVANLRADQRQLVEILKALATEAQVILFDEPTSALDRAQVDQFFKILRVLKSQGRSILFISHRMEEIFAISDRVTVLRDGETIGTEKIANTKPGAILDKMVGGQGERFIAGAGVLPTAAGAEHALALTVRNLSGSGFTKVSFTLAKGEILGFGGLHGQGQSSVLRALFGVHPIIAGEMLLNGKPFAASNPREAIRRGCAYVSGDRRRDGVISDRPILENVTPIHYLRQQLKLVRPSMLATLAKPALEALRTKFSGLSAPIHSLSGGNQQKIIIARWLIDRPDVLLLDDPTKGIDLSAKSDLFAQIRKLAAEGMGILLYSSEDAELLHNADRLLVFNGGQVRRELTGVERTRYHLYQAAYEAV